MENFSHGSLDSTPVIRVVGGLECDKQSSKHTVPRFLAGLIYACKNGARLLDEDSNPRRGSRDKERGGEIR